MTYLKNKDTNTIITQFVNFRKTQEVIRTLQTALDGTEYLTRFGAPILHYELTLYVDEKGKAALMKAEDQASLLEFFVKQGVFTGRIIKLGAFEYLAAGWYKLTVILAAQSEVSSP